MTNGGEFIFPHILKLGEFPAERVCSRRAVVCVPCSAKISVSIKDISVTPEVLEPGENTITVSCAPIRAGSHIFGEMFINMGDSVKMAYISGTAVEEAVEFEDNVLIFSPDDKAEPVKEEMIYPDLDNIPPDINEMYTPLADDSPSDAQSVLIIERGLSFKLSSDIIEVELIYDNKDFPMEVDAFAFLLDRKGNVTKDDRFVFFGNMSSGCRSVKYLNAPDKKVMYFNLETLPIDVSAIDIAYSIYKNPRGLNFSHLENPAVSIKTGDGKMMVFCLKPPLDRDTLVGIEIVYRNSQWELMPLGMAYSLGLENLCSNYGLKINQP